MEEDAPQPSGPEGAPRASWPGRIGEDLPQGGHLRALGPRHAAAWAPGGPVLIVSFDATETLRASDPGEMALGRRLARDRGWSHLHLVSRGATWFRDPAVYLYFDRLVDSGFFGDFDRVLFCGAGMAGYAAAAFSVASPGAIVLAIAPQATLDPRIAGWDDRYTSARRRCFSDRYGYAPDMIEAAERMFLAFDPLEPPEAMHASLFSHSNVTRLRCTGTGPDPALALNSMGILGELVERAAEGNLTAGDFNRLFRARRKNLPYLRNLSTRLEDDGRVWLNALLCRSVAERLIDPRFRARYAQLSLHLEGAGRRLPAHKPAATSGRGAAGA